MKYTMYNEENSVVNYDEYEYIKEKIFTKYKQEVTEVIVRKVKFVENKYKISKEDDIDNKPSFSLCMKIDKEATFYLEKKGRQNDVIYKSFVNLTEEECEKILCRDIQWLEKSKKALLNEFYLYITINDLEPATVMEYDREVVEKKGRICIVFNKEIKRAMDKEAGLLDKDIQMFDCLSCDKVVVSYKKIFNMPLALNNILHISNEHCSEVAFSL